MRLNTEAKFRVRAERYRREQRPAYTGPRGRTAWYIWRVEPGEMSKTRPEHRALNGKKFRWDDPPVVNPRTGERGHPGMDRYCKCYAEDVAD